MTKPLDIEAFTAWLEGEAKAAGVVGPILVRCAGNCSGDYHIWVGEMVALHVAPAALAGAKQTTELAAWIFETVTEYPNALALEYAYWNARRDVVCEIADRLGLNLWARNPEYDALYATGGLVDGAVFRGPADAAALAGVGFNALVRGLEILNSYTVPVPIPNIATPLAQGLKEQLEACGLSPLVFKAQPRAQTATEVAMLDAQRAAAENAWMKSWWEDRSDAERRCDPGLGPKSDPAPVPVKEKCPWLFPWPEPPEWNG